MKRTTPLRRMATALGAASLLLAVAACGSSSETDNDTAGGKTTVEWWHISTAGAAKEAFDAIADDYMADHPDVTIKQTRLPNEDFKAKLSTSLQAGEGPDIFHSWGGGTLAQYGEMGVIRDLTKDMEGEWGDALNPAAVEMASGDGKVFAAPYQLSGVGLWYNKALLAKAGVDQPPATWDEFLDAISKLKAAGITPVALGNKEGWEGMYWFMYLALRAGGGEDFQAVADGSGSMDSAPYIEAGSRVQELIDAGAFPDGFQGMDYAAEEAMMGSGKAAFELQGDWSPALQVANDPAEKGLGDDLGWTAFPTLDGGAGDAGDIVAGMGAWALSADASPEALDFVKYMTTPEVQSDLASDGVFLPSVTAAAADVKDPNIKQVSEALAAAPFLQNFYDQVLPQESAVPLTSAITSLFTGDKTPEEAAAAMQAAVERGQ